MLEAATGIEPVCTALQAVASPLGHTATVSPLRADDGIRTRDPHLGKVMRYQLRYIRIRPDRRSKAPFRCEREHYVNIARSAKSPGHPVFRAQPAWWGAPRNSVDLLFRTVVAGGVPDYPFAQRSC